MVRLRLDASVGETSDQVKGEVIYVDGFGNLITNLTRSRIERFAERCGQDRLVVTVGGRRRLRLSRTYADVPLGALAALFGSFEMLEIAVRDGSAATRLKAGAGSAVVIRADA
jgi:S-adenosylmethionine hydrolase